MDERKMAVKRLLTSLVAGLLMAALICVAFIQVEPAGISVSPALAEESSTDDLGPIFGPLIRPVVWNVELTPIDGGYHVSWEVHLPGDYNRDGKVNIADITPLAMHYGEEVESYPYDPYLAVVDGTKDGEITIDDLTTIARYYGLIFERFELACARNTLEQPRRVKAINWHDYEVPLTGWPTYSTDVLVEPGETRLCIIIHYSPYTAYLEGKSVTLPDAP
ncbi:hypothetical protein J7J84_01015 [bacterium]|nr:hypothetical protein [bacterium]